MIEPDKDIDSWLGRVKLSNLSLYFYAESLSNYCLLMYSFCKWKCLYHSAVINVKRSSNFKGKIGMITKLLHNLALIRDSLFSLILLTGLRKKDSE